MDTECPVRKMEWGENVSMLLCFEFAVHNILTRPLFIFNVAIQVITKPHTCWFSNMQSHTIPIRFFLSPAYISWKCTISVKAHHCCLEFGTRVDTSQHVWGISKMEVGKVSLCSTATSQNHCARVWWANTHAQSCFLLLLLFSLLISFPCILVWILWDLY